MDEKVTLHKDGSISISGAKVPWTWGKSGGWHEEYFLRDHRFIVRIKHYNRSMFLERVRDFQFKRGKFSPASQTKEA